MKRRKWLPLFIHVAETFSTSPGVPAYIRLYFAAFIRNRGDGHCHFHQGEMAKELGIDPRHTSREVRKLVKLGLAESESTARCVVLTEGHNMHDGKHAWCTWHGSRTTELRPQRAKKGAELRPQKVGSVSELRPEMAKFGSVDAGHSVAPSSSVLTPPEPPPAVSVRSTEQHEVTA